MTIIGHRGAAGIEPENTVASIKASVACGVDRIEFDIRVTKDNKLALFHDASLQRIAGLNRNLADMTLAELQGVKTKSGHKIPNFKEAVKAAGKFPLLIDCKGHGWAEILNEELKSYKGPTPMVTAADTKEMFRFSELRPDIETYVSELTKPFEAIYRCRLLGFTGISLNFWVLNPLAYYYAKRNKLKFMIFTVNQPLFARFLHFFYPSAAIITNVPHKMMPLAKRRSEKAKG